ncbi:DUF5363 domain-containing protein [uncultured Cardiobacterium sp.]|uniref:DUF5363 domain-containing protein n=1 Tax=uncultured Cardiobacterium sp. TaxID=417619 RepID=UPI002630AE1B|nr:DUF5363 domain-containing protein [uncultured Cardiobacterium sp.]
MRKEGENLFKWLWREYTEFCDESGLSQPGACRRCVPLVKEDPPLQWGGFEKRNDETARHAAQNRQESREV